MNGIDDCANCTWNLLFDKLSHPHQQKDYKRSLYLGTYLDEIIVSPSIFLIFVLFGDCKGSFLKLSSSCLYIIAGKPIAFKYKV